MGIKKSWLVQTNHDIQAKVAPRKSGQVLLFEGRYPLCRDSTGGASGLASAAIDTSGFVDLALVAILRNGFDRTRRHASATTDADSFINLMGHFELLLCMDEKKKREPGFFTLLVCGNCSRLRHKTQVAFESARLFPFRMGIGMRGWVEYFAESNQTLMVRIRRRRVCVPREGNRL